MYTATECEDVEGTGADVGVGLIVSTKESRASISATIAAEPVR